MKPKLNDWEQLGVMALIVLCSAIMFVVFMIILECIKWKQGERLEQDLDEWENEENHY